MTVIQRILDVEEHLAGIEGVIFDLDDTLYPEKAYVRSGYRAVAAAFPAVTAMEEKLWRVFQRGGKAIDEVLAAEGLDTEQNRRLALETYRGHSPEIRLYDGVAGMLDRLSAAGKLGIITDGRPAGQWAKIRALGLDRVVPEIIVTDELGGVSFRKPNEAAFVMMRDRMDMPFHKMAYVGDNGRKDFQAPEKLGMRSIWFQNKDGLYNDFDSLSPGEC